MKFIELITDPLIFLIFGSAGLSWWLLVIYFTKKGEDKTKVGEYLYLTIFFHVITLLSCLAISKNFELSSKSEVLNLFPNYFNNLRFSSNFIIYAFVIPFVYTFLFFVGIVAPIIIIYDSIISKEETSKIEKITQKILFFDKKPSFLYTIWFYFGLIMIFVFFVTITGTFVAFHDKLKNIIEYGL